MKGKVIALFLTLAFILVFVSSIDVVTLFHGSHNVINISASGNDIDCVPCHQQIRNELDKSTYHSGMFCEDCHRYEGAGIEFAEHNQTGKQAHAAYTLRCLDCHNYGTNYSAHKKFVEDSLNSSLSVGENEACIACHTNYSVDIEYSYFWNIKYTSSHEWGGISSFSYNGTRNNETHWSKSGAKHEFVTVSKIDCTKCHKNIYDALVTGTPKTDEDYLTHAPIENASNWNTDNPWGHYRYHYIPSANRATGVNSSYCYKCHNVKMYADDNPSDNTTYDLGNVTNDTNSTLVHCAEALSCQTCHGSGKTKVVIDNPDKSDGEMTGHTGTKFVDNVANNYTRTFHGDICMGCHEAAVHPSSGGGGCGKCHSDSHGNRDVYIESEPSGNATNEKLN